MKHLKNKTIICLLTSIIPTTIIYYDSIVINLNFYF